LRKLRRRKYGKADKKKKKPHKDGERESPTFEQKPGNYEKELRQGREKQSAKKNPVWGVTRSKTGSKILSRRRNRVTYRKTMNGYLEEKESFLKMKGSKCEASLRKWQGLGE